MGEDDIKGKVVLPQPLSFFFLKNDIVMVEVGFCTSEIGVVRVEAGFTFSLFFV